MYAAYFRTHHSQRRQEQLQVLRIPHHHREGHRSHLLSTACANRRRSSRAYSWPSARCAPGLRKPVQEVSRQSHLGSSYLNIAEFPSIFFVFDVSFARLPRSNKNHLRRTPVLP